MHARFWQNQSFFDKNRWLNGRNLQVERFLGSVLAVSLMKRGLSLAGRLVPEVIHEPALRYAANRAKMIALLNNVEHLTLTHYDCHPGNFFWNEKGPGFLDWQLVRIGEGVGDIAYFLATSLAPEDRKIYEKKLLSDYLAVLKQLGVAGLNEEQLYQRYQAHLCYAFEAMIVTLAIGDMMDLTSNLELIRRTSAAVFDNDSFKALLT